MNTNIYYLIEGDAKSLEEYLITHCKKSSLGSDQGVFYLESGFHGNYSVIVEHKTIPSTTRIPVHIIRLGEVQCDLFEASSLNNVIDDLMKKMKAKKEQVGV